MNSLISISQRNEINGQRIYQLVIYVLSVCGQTTSHKWDSHDESDDYDTVLNYSMRLVKEYPTMHHFGILIDTQSMTAYMILTA